MGRDYRQYSLFFDFIEAYSPVGFKGIDRNDPLILALEEMMKNNSQLLSVFDTLNMRNLLNSHGSIQMFGIKPEDLTCYHFKEATHPDDLKRHELGLVKLFKIAHELFIAKKGKMLISTNFRFRNPSGIYSNLMVQCYFFYVNSPIETVYMLDIKTNIDWYKKSKDGFHYYIGNDLSNLRYPDDELLKIGPSFTDREFEIIKLIKQGFNSKQIAEMLFVSVLTINTHRRNILDKTHKAHISDLIYDLGELGLL
jgi:hypothetical protein